MLKSGKFVSPKAWEPFMLINQWVVVKKQEYILAIWRKIPSSELNAYSRYIGHLRIWEFWRQQSGTALYQLCERATAGALRYIVSKRTSGKILNNHIELCKVLKNMLATPSYVQWIPDNSHKKYANNLCELECMNYPRATLSGLYCNSLWTTWIFQTNSWFSLQVDYESEAVAWEYIEFSDNRPCLDLLDANPGIFSLLNEVRISSELCICNSCPFLGMLKC